MKTYVKKMVVGLCVGSAFFAVAEEDGWVMSLGVSARQFDGVSIKSGVVGNAVPGVYVNGDWGAPNDYRIQGSSQLDPGGLQNSPGGTFVNTSFDRVSLSGGDDDVAAWGLVFGGRKRVNDTFGFELGFGGFTGDANATYANGSGATVTTYTGMLFTGAVPTTFPYTDASGDPLTTPLALGGGATTATNLQLDAEADLYVFSLGGTAEWRGDLLGLVVAAGPTVNVAAVESTVNGSVVWDAPGSSEDGQTIAALNERDRKAGICLGAYASIAADVKVTDAVSIGIQYRYDYLSDDFSTDHANFELDGHSLALVAIWQW